MNEWEVLSVSWNGTVTHMTVHDSDDDGGYVTTLTHA